MSSRKKCREAPKLTDWRASDPQPLPAVPTLQVAAPSEDACGMDAEAALGTSSGNSRRRRDKNGRSGDQDMAAEEKAG